jgi:hypothetical protein
MMSMDPKGSMLSSFVFKGSVRYVLELAGTLRNIARPARTTPPMGRLLSCKCEYQVETTGENGTTQYNVKYQDSCHVTHIQKHHLHDTSWVNAQPRTGPTVIAIKKTLNTVLMYMARCSKATVWLIILKDPWRAPAAPKPATALPTINIWEFTAAAQSTEPTGKRRERHVQYIGGICMRLDRRGATHFRI